MLCYYIELSSKQNVKHIPKQTARQAGFKMPAEWGPHERCWMAWPCRTELWGDNLAATKQAYANVANAIAEFEPLVMLTPPSAVDAAAKLCGERVELITMELDDSWTRDNGPNFLKGPNGELGASLFHFNAWGQKYKSFRKDAALGERLCEYLGIRHFSSPLFMEGGGINVDGAGTVLTSETCVMNANRNPSITRRDAETELSDALGADKTIWLPGDPDDVETDGHVDGIACFVREGVVMVTICPDKSLPRAESLQKNVRSLEQATDAKGRRLEIILIEEAFEAKARSKIFARSYINFYLANGGVVMPGFGISRDKKAREVVQACFPDREVVQIDINDIALGGGGIHCITQLQPA